ncbi:thioredoxin family protein [Thorsellia kenyensis]|uniref:Thioredoxin n=1 Tax=Thorsellia kenyensis TaxID=1549888 RepID=A0ABV6C9M8_9GAMM
MSVIELNNTNFQKTIEDNSIVIIDFWAPWCGPCVSFAPIFEAVANEHPDMVFAKVNTQVEQELANAFQIRGIPQLMVFRDNIMLYSESGALPQNALEELVNQVKQLDMDAIRNEIAQGKHS